MEEISDNKTRIAAKSLELFMLYGIKRVSMDEIAGAVGMSKKTIYQHYANKDELVMDIVTSILQKNCSEGEYQQQVAENAIHEGFLAIDQSMELFRRMNPLLIFDLKKYHPKAYKSYLDFKSNFLYKILKSFLERGISEGLFREDFNIDLVARFRVESISIPFEPEFYNNVKIGLDETTKELFYIFLYGIASRKGYKIIDKYRKKSKSTSNAKN